MILCHRQASPTRLEATHASNSALSIGGFLHGQTRSVDAATYDSHAWTSHIQNSLNRPVVRLMLSFEDVAPRSNLSAAPMV